MKELCGQSAQTFRPTLDGWLELIHPADRAAAQAAMTAAMRERKQLHNQYRIVRPDGSIGHVRSEEHTSKLQSPCNLVCRLLLEKKKKNTHTQLYYLLKSITNSTYYYTSYSNSY